MRKILNKSILLFLIIIIFFTTKVFATELKTTTTNSNLNTLALETVSNILKEKVVIDSDECLDITYDEFLEKIENSEIKIIYYTKNIPSIYVLDINDNYYLTINPEYETFKKDMLEKGIIVANRDLVITTQEQEANKNSNILLWIIFGGAGIFGIGYWMHSKTKNNKITFLNKQKVSVGKVKDYTFEERKQKDPSIKTFDDVAGLKEVKKDMVCLVDFMKNTEKYKKAGAKLPKGVILYGPPGTGKTLIAKAVAGEAGVPFMYMSGSDFIEMYVGVGAKRVRELFEKAKKNAPCIVFIDEIDAIGGKRNGNDSSGEDRKTINALLTEMDGFNTTDNILVIGATNRIEDLDSALTRPGRFTNKYCVPLPSTAKERLEIIKLYATDKKFSEDVNFNILSKETMGFSPAQIESLLNESAIISVQDKKDYIDSKSIEKAMFKTLLSGHMKENQKDRDKEELKLVAWHEAGHALIGKLNGKEVNKVTIISSTSGAGGVTFTTPNKMGLQSVEDLKNEVLELYGGRVAEFLLFNNKEKVTTGASNDIERATNIIKEIVSTYGMTDSFGLLNLTQLNVNQSILTEEEIKLSKELESKTLEILKKNYSKLEKIANKLLEDETLYESDLDEIIFNKKE